MTSQVTLSSYAIIVTRKSWVMGQFTDGSDWLWVTKRDRSPLLALSHIATANTSKPVQNENSDLIVIITIVVCVIF